MNPAEKAQNRAESVIEKRLRKVYGNARDEMRKQLTAFEKRTKSLEASMVAKRDRGEITDDELKKWRQYRVFRGENWRSQIDAMTQTLEQSNRVALQIVNGKTSDVFAAGRNYEAYEIESDIGARIGTSFELYDEATVARLLRKQPELLPRRKKLNGQKDRAWNTKNISDTVTSGILQGKSLQEVTQDLAKSLSSTNMKAMSRYAQTAMTGAQNAGRVEAMHTAQNMGIKIRKKWLATLDRHTRVSHQKMDGKVVDIDEAFPNGLQYPGDPDGDPAEVYNCRCTLINVYPEYPAANGKRRDGEGNVLGEMTYKEWENAKKGIRPFRMGDEAKKPIAKNIEQDIIGTASEATKKFMRELPVFDRSSVTDAEILKRVNPHFYGEYEHKWHHNCQRCVTAEELLERGYNVTAKSWNKSDPIGSIFWNAWEFDEKKWKADKGFKQFELRSQVKSGISSALNEWGDGSRAVLRVKWQGKYGGGGHFLYVKNIKGNAVVHDPQKGTVEDIDNVLKKVSTGANHCWLMRVDNRKLNDNIVYAVEGVKK